MKKSSIRLALEGFVIAWNTPIREAVSSMDVIELLRNAHPSYRGVYASELHDAGEISKFDLSEFVYIKTPKSKFL
jgi:hypothetical protein